MSIEVNGCYVSKDMSGVTANAVRVAKVSEQAVYCRNIVTDVEYILNRRSWEATMLPFNLPRPKEGSEWTHKNGNTYQVTGLSNLEHGRQEEYPTTVSYRNVQNNKPYSRKLVDWYRSMTPRKLTNAEKAFDAFIRNGIGWTEFAKTHTAHSAKEYKATWLAGFEACYGRYISMPDVEENCGYEDSNSDKPSAPDPGRYAFEEDEGDSIK